MIDFTTLRSLTGPDISRELDPRYVLHVHGHQPAAQEAGRWLYHSPFRPDETPSYTVRRLEDGRYRCGDLAREQEGDVLDLLRDITGVVLPFTEVNGLARQMLRTQQESGWTAPVLTQTARSVPVQDRVVRVIQDAPLTALTAFLQERREDGTLKRPGLDGIPAAYLRQTYGVAEIGEDLLIPYTHPDGSIAALKRRAPGEGTKSLPGYRYGDLLYGLHLLYMLPGVPVLLCEGETDTWAAAWYCRGCVAVGLPAGAHPPTPAQLEHLSHREVYVCFDADAAGDAAAEHWPFPRIRPPEGKDLASLPPATLKELLTCQPK